MITIAYMTNRKVCHIRWFLDSLKRELDGSDEEVQLVVVDFYKGLRELDLRDDLAVTHVKPKPCVWQGEYRLTSRDYFAAANARNTAVCVAKGDYLVCVDDLSVLVPGWLKEVERARAEGWVACGSYGKVKELRVSEGRIRGFKGLDEEALSKALPGDVGRVILEGMEKGFSGGVDSRLKKITHWDPLRCDGGWAFGCSFGAPLNAILQVNGWDEDNDSMGGEDYAMGIMLVAQGFKLHYIPRMMTLESEEDHGNEEPFLRIIKELKGKPDASHVMLNWLRTGRRKKSLNYMGSGGLRGLRDLVLSTGKFPVIKIPQHDWRDGQPLREM